MLRYLTIREIELLGELLLATLALALPLATLAYLLTA